MATGSITSGSFALWGGRPRLCVDFDDTIHLLDGWEPGQSVTAIEGEPVRGAREAIAELRKDFEIIVLSSRAEKPNGRGAIAEWLREQRITVDGITAVKPPAVAYVDDNAVHFYGVWPETVKDVRHFRQWREARKPE
jgi:hypothetical protein